MQGRLSWTHRGQAFLNLHARPCNSAMLQCTQLPIMAPTSRALIFKSSCWILNCSSCCSALTMASCRSCSFSVKYWTYCLACCTPHHMFCQHRLRSLDTVSINSQQTNLVMHLASTAYAMHGKLCVRNAARVCHTWSLTASTWEGGKG